MRRWLGGRGGPWLVAVLLALVLAPAPAAARPDFPGWDPDVPQYDAAWRRAHMAAANPTPTPTPSPSPTPGETALRMGSEGEPVRELQLRLCALGFMPYDPSLGSCESQANGTYGRMTRDAVYALQKLHRLRRDGVFGQRTATALAATSTVTWPSFCDQRRSTVWCVDQQRQLAWVRDSDGRVRVHHTSTGGRYTYESRSNPGRTVFAATPVGRYRITGARAARHDTPWGPLSYTSCPSWWCLHPYGSVPVYAASHGCVRRPTYLGAWGFRIARVGTYVHVVNRAPG